MCRERKLLEEINFFGMYHCEQVCEDCITGGDRMVKYRKKPIVVEAEVYREGLEDYFKYHIPMFGTFTKEECIEAGFTPDFEKGKIPFIKTLEGEHVVSPGDYIITGIKGERYPCKPDIFEATYEKVEE
jgi:hypothetical protein